MAFEFISVRIVIGFSFPPVYRHIWGFCQKKIQTYHDYQIRFKHRLYHREEFLTGLFWFTAPVNLSVCHPSLAACVGKNCIPAGSASNLAVHLSVCVL